MDKQEWFEKNGFNAEGDTYIIVGIDTYAIKNELKAAGWKYNSWLRWHGPDPSAFPNNVHKLYWDKAYSFTAWGEALSLPGIQKQIFQGGKRFRLDFLLKIYYNIIIKEK